VSQGFQLVLDNFIGRAQRKIEALGLEMLNIQQTGDECDGDCLEGKLGLMEELDYALYILYPTRYDELTDDDVYSIISYLTDKACLNLIPAAPPLTVATQYVRSTTLITVENPFDVSDVTGTYDSGGVLIFDTSTGDPVFPLALDNNTQTSISGFAVRNSSTGELENWVPIYHEKIYVSANGSNITGKKGDIYRPYLTIQGAAAIMSAGDTIEVLDGDHTINSVANGITLVNSSHLHFNTGCTLTITSISDLVAGKGFLLLLNNCSVTFDDGCTLTLSDPNYAATLGVAVNVRNSSSMKFGNNCVITVGTNTSFVGTAGSASDLNHIHLGSGTRLTASGTAILSFPQTNITGNGILVSTSTNKQEFLGNGTLICEYHFNTVNIESAKWGTCNFRANYMTLPASTANNYELQGVDFTVPKISFTNASNTTGFICGSTNLNIFRNSHIKTIGGSILSMQAGTVPADTIFYNCALEASSLRGLFYFNCAGGLKRLQFNNCDLLNSLGTAASSHIFFADDTGSTYDSGYVFVLNASRIECTDTASYVFWNIDATPTHYTEITNTHSNVDNSGVYTGWAAGTLTDRIMGLTVDAQVKAYMPV
jgi:hypothetical protein